MAACSNNLLNLTFEIHHNKSKTLFLRTTLFFGQYIQSHNKQNRELLTESKKQR